MMASVFWTHPVHTLAQTVNAYSAKWFISPVWCPWPSKLHTGSHISLLVARSLTLVCMPAPSDLTTRLCSNSINGSFRCCTGSMESPSEANDVSVSTSSQNLCKTTLLINRTSMGFLTPAPRAANFACCAHLVDGQNAIVLCFVLEIHSLLILHQSSKGPVLNLE